MLRRMNEQIGAEFQKYAAQKEKNRGLQASSDEVQSAFDVIHRHFIDRGWLNPKFKVALNYVSRQDMLVLFGRKYDMWSAHNAAGFVDPELFRDGSLLVNMASDYWKFGFSDKVVIAHEMVHVEQYARGDLKLIDGQIWWRGVASTTFVKKGYTYKQFPWEVEAFERMYPIIEEIGSNVVHPQAQSHRRKGPQIVHEIVDMIR